MKQQTSERWVYIYGDGERVYFFLALNRNDRKKAEGEWGMKPLCHLRDLSESQYHRLFALSFTYGTLADIETQIRDVVSPEQIEQAFPISLEK